MPSAFRRLSAVLTIAAASLIAVPCVAPSVGSSAVAASRPIASLANIELLAAEAYVWGLAAEFTWRFAKYNTTISAPMNALTYGVTPAAWNNSATNAGDSSVIYINGFMDFSSGDELVLTVPPSRNQYYVVNYLDNYINTIGSIGTRTTPSDASQSYLLVGPKSRFAKKKFAKIDGHVFPVMASDTNLNWMLIRILTSTLADSTEPDSTQSVYNNVSKSFVLNKLSDFRANNFQPVPPESYSNPPPTDEQLARAEPYKDTPEEAKKFFEQLGQSLVESPIPPLQTALGGTPVGKLPPYVVPQYGAKTLYVPPSFGQKRTLQRFAKIGLTENGFKEPAGWGPLQRAALQRGYDKGREDLQTAIDSQAAGESTNYWTILNDMIGNYANTKKGYLVRSTIVLNGGSANIPLDAVYPSMTSYNGTTLLDGNQTYKITFDEPTPNAQLPVVGIFPPQVTDAQGKIKGFWSLTVYQPDASEVAAPFLPQSSVLNNYYSTADSALVAISSSNDTITVSGPTWGKLVASTPIIFGGNGASGCGLQVASPSQNAVYYVANDPQVGSVNGETTYTFQLAPQWRQELSDNQVPIQYSGAAQGGPVNITCDNPAAVSYGMLKPVSQLGSSELEDDRLERNQDGSVTLWLSPTLPLNAPQSNWIPTPSDAYYNSIYGANPPVSTTLQVILRTYYPTPGNNPPSILPYKAGNMPESYIPPAIILDPNTDPCGSGRSGLHQSC